MIEVRGVADEPVHEQLQPPLAAWEKPSGRTIPVIKFRLETPNQTYVQVYYKGATVGTVHVNDDVTVRGTERSGVVHAEYIYNHSTDSQVTAGGCRPCFVATAVYGTPMADDVVLLRAFRDDVLLASPVGRLLVAAYYSVAPPVARLVRQSDLVSLVLRRFAVGPAVRVAKRTLARGSPKVLKRRRR